MRLSAVLAVSLGRLTRGSIQVDSLETLGSAGSPARGLIGRITTHAQDWAGRASANFRAASEREFSGGELARIFGACGRRGERRQREFSGGWRRLWAARIFEAALWRDGRSCANFVLSTMGGGEFAAALTINQFCACGRLCANFLGCRLSP